MDGEVWSLASWLEENDESTLVQDAYWTKDFDLSNVVDDTRQKFKCIVVHLWKVDALQSEIDRFLNQLSAQLADSAYLKEVPLVLFGYTVGAIVKSSGAFKSLVSAYVTASDVIQVKEDDPDLDIVRITLLIQSYLSAQTGGANLAPRIHPHSDQNGSISEGTIVSLHASRGCRSRCSFCCYNSDLVGGWAPRRIATVVDEIEVIIRTTKTRKISFFDNDFGGSLRDLSERAEEMHRVMSERGLLGIASISINVRSECLDRRNMTLLKEIGVKNLLIGVESFNDTTLRKVFRKKQSKDRLISIVEIGADLGLNLVLSYILWHPWQTIESLRWELGEIDKVGRHLIPQFLTRSLLQVVPGTPVEKMIELDGLTQLDQSGKFRFMHNSVQAAYSDCSDYFSEVLEELQSNIGAGQETDPVVEISKAKIKEWEFYKTYFQI